MAEARPAEERPLVHPADQAFDLLELRRSLRRPRTFFSWLLSVVTFLLTVIATIPLFSVLYMLVTRGGESLSLDLFTELTPSALDEGGGVKNAIVGTLVMTGLAAAIAVPFGILGAIWLADFGPESKVATAARFAAKVLTGLPSIIAGVFAFTVVVLTMGQFSALAGGIALSILMLPIVMLTADEAIKAVPQKMKDAAIGMGCTQAQVMGRVTLPTALPALLTGVMLAVARAAGETAPLLFTATFSFHSFSGLQERTASLAVFIFNSSGKPFENLVRMSWSAALVLVSLVLMFNLIGQAISRRASHPGR